MIVDIKLLNSSAKLPTRANPGDAGLDIVATSVEITQDYVQYGTGLSMAIPAGYRGCIYSRSSISKKNLILCNSVGIIDSQYRGEIFIRFDKRDHDKLGSLYEPGDKIAQLTIEKVNEITFNLVDELGDTVRGSGGFGSSDLPLSNFKLSEL